MIRPRKLAILIHRWMGVGCCALFVVWFASGIVLMDCDYPLVHAEERLARAALLDASRIHLSPEQALGPLEVTEAPDRVRLTMTVVEILVAGWRAGVRFRRVGRGSAVYDAGGVDGVTWRDSQTGLEDRIIDLHSRVYYILLL